MLDAFAALPVTVPRRPAESLSFASDGLSSFVAAESRGGARVQPAGQSSRQLRSATVFSATGHVRSFMGNPIPRIGRTPTRVRMNIGEIDINKRTIRCSAAEETPHSAADKLEEELKELEKELETVEKTLNDLNTLIAKNEGNPKLQALGANLRAQAEAIEEAKARLQEDLDALRTQAAAERAAEERRARELLERSPSPESGSQRSPAGRRVREILRSVNKMADSLEESETAVDHKEALEDDLAVLEERLLALSRRRKELEAREASTIESAMKADSNAKRKEMLRALKADLENDTKQLDAELVDLANEVETLRQRLLESQPRRGRGPAITIDLPYLQRTLQKSVKKVKEGGRFFWRGTKLLGVDATVAVRAIVRAVEGKPLSQRDVEHMKRFATDLLAVVPFSIILAIPLSPVGHVFIFGLIQKYVPALMPSTFQPERVALMERLEAIQVGLKATNRAAAPAPSSSSSASFTTVAAGAPVVGRPKEEEAPAPAEAPDAEGPSDLPAPGPASPGAPSVAPATAESA